MKNYDLIVIGGGSGGIVINEAISHGLNVGFINNEPPGGTCMNFGCIPTKKVIFPADRIIEIQEAKKLGITAEIKDVDFNAIMERMRSDRDKSRERIREGIRLSTELDFYGGSAHFINDYTLEINGGRIKGDKIVIATGARPLILPIKGLKEVDYLTNETILELKERPDSIIIIGGGYIAVEFAHFLSAVGIKVTILEMLSRIVTSEEPEISDLLKKKMSKRMNIFTDTKVIEVKKEGNGYKVVGKDLKSSKGLEFSGQKILLAVGRESNADILKVEKTGVETDEKGFIKVNKFLETSKENIWALGDATGRYMFKHVSNQEAALLAHNIIHKERKEMDYSVVPHAIFTYPEVASFGLREEEAKENYDILIGKSNYSEVAMGRAMMEEEGFAKAIVNKENLKILGFHIIGPYASMLIQEVINLAALNVDIRYFRAMHIHPALPELIITTLNNLS